MKVVFFVGSFPIRSETFVINQINGLIALGVDVEIVALAKGDLPSSATSLQTNQLLSKTRYLLNEKYDDNKVLKLVKRATALLSRFFTARVISTLNITKWGGRSKSLLLPAIAANINKPINTDVVIAHFGVAGVIAHELQQLNLLNGKIMTVFHGADISVHRVLETFKEDYHSLFLNTAALLPISELWRQRLISLGCPAEKIQVNRMGININDFHCRDLNNPLSTPVSIITVARFTEKKGLFDAVSAMVLLKQQGISFKYQIVGGGPLKAKLERHIATCDLADEVELLGHQAPETIKSLLDLADVFLLPSITAENGDMEGIPVALMEAMAVGLIAVSTLHSGIPELIEDGVSGFLAPEGDPQQLAEIIKNIANGNVELGEIRGHALNTIQTRFNQKILYQQLADIVQTVNEH